MGMRTPSAGRFLAACSLVAMTIWPTVVGAQNSRDLYKDAMKAVDVQDWQTAIGLLRQAIEDDPVAKAGTFKRYIPHYYLGLGLFEMGSCKAALTVWAESHQQGVIKRLKEISTLQQGVSVCRKRLLRQETTNDLAEITGFAAALRDLRDQPELAEAWKTGSPSWDERFVAAEQLMAAAQSVLDKSDSQLEMADLEKARDHVVSAAQQLEVIQTEARTEFTEVQAKLDVRSRLIEMVLVDAREVLGATTYLEPYPQRFGGLRGQVERLVAEAEKSDKTVQPDQLDELRMRLSSALESLKQASVPPPDSLVRAAEAYFLADHGQVLEILGEEQFPSGRQAAHAHLLRAASLYSLWVAGDELDDLTRAEASSAVRSCRAEDISLVPLDRAFSPRFAEFFFSEGQSRAPIPLDEE